MNLYEVVFTADSAFGSKTQSEHQIILVAETDKEAEKAAEGWFIQNGAYTGSANPITLERRTPQIRKTRSTILSAITVYQGKLRDIKPMAERAENYRQMTDQHFSNLIHSMPAAEFDRRCTEDPEFKKKADEVRR
jgi:hypothetical protein